MCIIISNGCVVAGINTVVIRPMIKVTRRFLSGIKPPGTGLIMVCIEQSVLQCTIIPFQFIPDNGVCVAVCTVVNILPCALVGIAESISINKELV